MTSRYHHHQHRHPHSRAPSISSTSTASTTIPTSTGPNPTLNSQPNSRGGPSTTTMAPSTSIRRNLFHHHLSRRPASAASSSSASISATSTAGNHTATGLSEVSRTTAAAAAGTTSTTSATVSSSLSSSGPTDNGDIVIRDQNGNYKLDIPVLPPVMLDEDGDDAAMEGVEEGGRTSGGSGSTGVGSGSAVDTELGGREKEKIEASLVEMMYRNRSRQLSSEPAEILNLLHQSLRNKVAGLDEDNWMYEVEDDVHI